LLLGPSKLLLLSVFTHNKTDESVIGRPFRATSSHLRSGSGPRLHFDKLLLGPSKLLLLSVFTHNKTDESVIGRPFRATFILLVNFFRTPEKFAKMLKKLVLIYNIYCIFITFLKKINIFY
jgi:hypothetical protein